MNSSSIPGAAARAPHRILIMIAVSSSMLLGSVDGSIVNIALPTLTRALQAPFHLVEWAVLSFLLGVSTLTLSMGRLGDIVGKKRVFITGVVIFLSASALCGTARGIYSLIVFRFVQSVGAAMMMSLAIAIVAETWPPEKRATAMGIVGGVLSLGGMAGPALGGWILHLLNWRWIFFVNLPIGLVSLALAWTFIPPLLPERRGQTFDFIGAALAGLSMFAIVLAMTLIQTHGLLSAPLIGWAIVALGTFAAFIYTEQRVSDPMLDLSLFRNPSFCTSLVSGFSVFVSVAGVLLLFPFYLQLVAKLEQQQIGMVMAITPVMLGIWGPFSGMLADRFGARLLTILGLASVVTGYFTLSWLGVSSGPAAFVLLQLPMALGMASFTSANNAAIMTAVPRERLGIANGMLTMTRTVGSLSGVALLGTFFYCRLETYVGHAVEVTIAPPASLVRALHDQFHLADGIVALGLIIVLRQAVREWRARRLDSDAIELEAASMAESEL